MGQWRQLYSNNNKKIIKATRDYLLFIFKQKRELPEVELVQVQVAVTGSSFSVSVLVLVVVTTLHGLAPHINQML